MTSAKSLFFGDGRMGRGTPSKVNSEVKKMIWIGEPGQCPQDDVRGRDILAFKEEKHTDVCTAVDP
jgi:hypothetical protein